MRKIIFLCIYCIIFYPQNGNANTRGVVECLKIDRDLLENISSLKELPDTGRFEICSVESHPKIYIYFHVTIISEGEGGVLYYDRGRIFDNNGKWSFSAPDGSKMLESRVRYMKLGKPGGEFIATSYIDFREFSNVMSFMNNFLNKNYLVENGSQLYIDEESEENLEKFFYNDNYLGASIISIRGVNEFHRTKFKILMYTGRFWYLEINTQDGYMNIENFLSADP